MSDIYLRKIPEDLVRRVKAHAALQGMTMTQFVVEALEKVLKDEGAATPKRAAASRKQ